MSSATNNLTHPRFLPVVRGDDRVLLALGDIAAVPLADAGAACVSEHHGAGVTEDLGNVVALDGGADLLGAGGHGELALQLQALVCKSAGRSICP